MESNAWIYCEMLMCIYNKNRYCLLRSIKITVTGHCDEATIPDVPENVREEAKRVLLNELLDRQKKWEG